MHGPSSSSSFTIGRLWGVKTKAFVTRAPTKEEEMAPVHGTTSDTSRKRPYEASTETDHVDPTANSWPLNAGCPLAPPPPRVSWSRRRSVSTTINSGQGADVRARSSRIGILGDGLHLPVFVSGDRLSVFKQVRTERGVFVTGPPGAGKTYLLRQVVTFLRVAGVAVTVCGSSGMAASMVGGITAHSWAGIVLGHAVLDLPLQHVLDKVIPAAAKDRMRDAMVLVIDEIGSISAKFIERLDLVLRAVRGISSPFGGVKVIFADDVLQLAPSMGSFAFCCNVWKEVFGDRAVLLTSSWRHVDDLVFMLLLRRKRVWKQTAADLALLATRRSDAPSLSAAWLTTHTALETVKNKIILAQLEGTDVEFVAEDAVIALTDHMVAVHTNVFSKSGVPAGTCGVVINYAAAGSRQFPVVRFFLSTGGYKSLRVLRTMATVFALDGHSHAASRTQVPLALSWASTIHSAQGWTLPSVAVDLEDAFAPGQVLSALSRTPRLTSLHFVSFDSQKIIVNDVAVAFHDSLGSV